MARRGLCGCRPGRWRNLIGESSWVRGTIRRLSRCAQRATTRRPFWGGRDGPRPRRGQPRLGVDRECLTGRAAAGARTRAADGRPRARHGLVPRLLPSIAAAVRPPPCRTLKGRGPPGIVHGGGRGSSRGPWRLSAPHRTTGQHRRTGVRAIGNAFTLSVASERDATRPRREPGGCRVAATLARTYAPRKPRAREIIEIIRRSHHRVAFSHHAGGHRGARPRHRDGSGGPRIKQRLRVGIVRLCRPRGPSRRLRRQISRRAGR